VKSSRRLVISIVSHGHAHLLRHLLANIDQKCDSQLLTVVVTENLADQRLIDDAEFSLDLHVIQNKVPKGFASNHNAVFRLAEPSTFCVLNPDITFAQDPFGPLLDELAKERMGIVAPVVVDSEKKVADSARMAITPRRIGRRILGIRAPDYIIGSEPIFPDWVAGMFMLFSGEVFSALGGFDERFHMYCEDSDICMRARDKGYRIAVTPKVTVCHAAQRRSHRNMRYCAWHINSLCRFFWKHRGFGTKARKLHGTVNGWSSAST
jgi:N-acetylglucosaminyl-diphospho-decaprenol L-rhamnosyltransferase